MPAKPTWLVRIPQILDDLQQLSVPVVDRGMFERLFDVRRRRAITLMRDFGACQAGGTLLIDRLKLIEKLGALKHGQEFEQERRRKQRLRDSLDELHRSRAGANIPIRPLPLALRKRLPDLPIGIRVGDRELAIEYDNVEQLLQRLYELSQAAAADFEAFATVVRPTIPAR